MDHNIARVLDSITDGFAVVDSEWRLTYLNRQAEETLRPLGKSRETSLGRNLWTEFPDLVGSEFEKAYRRAVAQRTTEEIEAFYPPLAAWFAVRAYPSQEGLSILFQDVSRRKQAELRLAAERSILEMIAGGAGLAEVLESITQACEQQSVDGMICSILLLDDSGQHLLHGAAPSLPAAYNEAIHGIAIGPGVGSCGTAAYEKTQVTVADIATHPYWVGFKDLAQAHGLAACCSTPLFAADGALLGTIAMYYRRPWTPREADVKIMELAARLASIAIQRQHAEEALRRSEEFSRGVIESSRDCFKTLSLDGRLTWISERGCQALCIDDVSTVLGQRWVEFWQGGERQLAQDAVTRAAAGEAASFIGCFPVEGKDRWWDVAVTPIRGTDGRPERLLAVSRDITERFEADARIKESAEQLRQLANAIPQLAWMAEPDGHIFWYNEGWYRYTGSTPGQMEGWGWQSVHDPAVLPDVLEKWRSSLATAEPFEMEFPLKGADGVYRWFLTRVNPMRDSRGRVIRWFGTNTDVDSVRRIRQALEEETGVLELLNRTGMALASRLDLQDLLQTVTDAATKLSGAQFGAFFYNMVDERGEAYQLYTLAGAPREAFEKFGQPRATALFGPTFRGEGVVRCDDVLLDPRYGRSEPHKGMPPGHLPVRSYLAVPVMSASGEVLGGLFFGHAQPGVFNQRSERLVAAVAAQAAVAVDNARLYQAAQKAAEERKLLLESERHARSAAEHAARMKDEFLATLSHELRTPLSAILGWTQVLRLKGPAPEDLRKGLDAIERNARVQTQLVEELLDMSRIASGKLRFELQALQAVSFVEAALDTVRPLAQAKNIGLVAVLDRSAGLVRGDAARLQQVVWNLLSNALKFTPDGGQVRVELRRCGEQVAITVSDTGQGIDPRFMAHLFERFRQADASITRRHGGLGLGLSIVKHLVEAHGGSIEATSAGENQGASFTVKLPLATGSEDPSAVAADGAARPLGADFRIADLAGIKVLVVDDQSDARELVARILTECRADVACASGAREALEMLPRERPAIMVSDIGMPEVDGFELLARVRRMGGDGGGVPAIALTAFARPEDEARVLQAGFACHVSKPVEPAELIARVAALARRDPAAPSA